MKDIVLIKPIKEGCYSDNSEERENSNGGFHMDAGAIYRCYEADIVDKKERYPAYYICGTHIIYTRDIDWNIFEKLNA